MHIVRTLVEKPWLEDGLSSKGIVSEYTRFQSKKFALNTFLVIVSVLFSLFIVTFLARSQYPDFVALAGEVWQPFFDSTRLWVNTVFLCLASVSLHCALKYHQLEKIRIAMVMLFVALIFSLQFLVAQVYLWKYLYNLGFYMASNPANSYFFLLTGIHGLHLIGGVIVIFVAIVNFYLGNRRDSICSTVELCVRYWHYLFILWMCIFLLMTSSPSTYKTLAALCGY